VETILITGGTGHLGHETIARLQGDTSKKIRVLARSPGEDSSVDWVKGDLATGDGIADAVAGAQTVVHAATFSPAARRGYLLPADMFRSPPAVDVDGTRRLLDEARRAGVAHFLYVSIVGVEHARLPYARLKAAAEKLVRSSEVPWSIARATGFYWLLDRMLGRLERLPVWPLPTRVPMQTVDSADFAGYLVECLAEGPRGDREDFAGPEILRLGEIAKQYQDARGIRRRLLAIPLPAAVARAAGGLTAADGRRGTTTWAEWLRRRYPRRNT
jgi:uncharacterized protein YbjT (DUF2867 family)